jgi:hypothetical protein
MEATQDATRRAGVIVLDKVNIQTGQITKTLFIEALKKEATLIAEYLRFQNQDIRDGGWGNLHTGLQYY